MFKRLVHVVDDIAMAVCIIGIFVALVGAHQYPMLVAVPIGAMVVCEIIDYCRR